MDPNQNRPKAREKQVTSGGTGVHRRGDGLGTGAVGASGGNAGKNSGGGSSVGKRAAAGGGGLVAIIGVILSQVDLIGCYNYLASRKLPQYYMYEGGPNQ